MLPLLLSPSIKLSKLEQRKKLSMERVIIGELGDNQLANFNEDSFGVLIRDMTLPV